MKANEVNFDSIVGPTHNYSGLSPGNIASTSHEKMISSPKEAALQGLNKMKFLLDMGIPQAVIPPQDRPHIQTLRALGFSGTESEIIEQAYKTAPDLYLRCCSASSMWAANIATVTPSFDTVDGKVHFTPANLVTMFHRSIETEQTEQILKKIFNNENFFTVHPALIPCLALADEGSANHTRLCPEYGEPGLHLFTYGQSAFNKKQTPSKFPARQTLEACQAIARNHRIYDNHSLFLQQNPEAIDSGVFHNDVIAVGDRYIFFYHEKAYFNQNSEIQNIKNNFETLCDRDLKCIEVKESEVSLKDAVDSYLFNSQIVALPEGKTALIAPVECREHTHIQKMLSNLVADTNCPIDLVRYVDLRESMSNGGGPACVRLRVVLNENELAAIHPGVILTESLYSKLKNWIEIRYRDTLNPKELADPRLLDENRLALDELTQILNLGSVYAFQK